MNIRTRRLRDDSDWKTETLCYLHILCIVVDQAVVQILHVALMIH